MKDLGTRSISSIVFVVLILGPLLLGEKIAFTVYTILGGFTLSELINLSKRSGNEPMGITAFLVYVFLVLIAYLWLFEEGAHLRLPSLALGVMVMASLLLEVFRLNQRPFGAVSSTIFAPFFVGLSFLGIAYFYAWRSDLPSFWVTASTFALIWINDAGAYLFGRKIGKRKLFERLSPNKTIEGSLSGLFCALLASIGFAQFEGMPSIPIMLGFSLVLVITGSLGDLFESRMKRDAGLKDSGTFLPGHGGFFDRFDAMMLAIPSAILFFELFYPKP